MGFENLGFTQAVREYEKRGVIVYDRLNTSPYSKRMLDSFNLLGAIRVAPFKLDETNFGNIRRINQIYGKEIK
ncbi:MAG: aminotransferase class [Firmicutes bacterium]|nr:aminotransferase class [Bacillota bacterium]